ncbi:MAG: glutathione S-transferase family protein [Planctomycetota bacterium]
MGLLVDGHWRDRWYDMQSTGGRFKREAAGFRNWIEDAPGATHPPEAGRYHLYVSWACPWAHRTLVVRRLKHLEQAISVSSVGPLMLEHGWEFTEAYPDPLGGRRYLHQVYTDAASAYTGRVTVPVLWDKQRATIVSNESSEIIRMLDGPLAACGQGGVPELYPAHLRADIDAVNAGVYEHVNNGVYKAGFATTQAAYEEAVHALFAALDRLERRLEGQRWLVGDALTEADVRLFTTLLRFDPVYHGHFKCNIRRLCDYPNLWKLTCRLYQQPGVAETVDLGYIKQHYYGSHRTINPTGIVPVGPAIDYAAPVRD